MEADKVAAYMTLYTALVTTAKAAAPMIPFMAEDIYRNLVCTVDASAPVSVHLCDFPVADESMIDTKLEDDMEFILRAVNLGRSARNGANMKNRQPLAAMYIKTDREVSDYYRDIVMDEMNVKSAEFVPDVSAFSSYNFKPQLKTVGPKYGKLLGKIKDALAGLDGNAAMDELEANGALVFNFDGEEVRLERDDLLIEVEQKGGYFSVADMGITVAIDTNLTDELIDEGFVRELISKIQTMRKDSDFDVTDHIAVAVSGSDKITAIMDKFADEVNSAVLCDRAVSDSDTDKVEKEWNINGESVTITVVRL